MYRLTYIPYPDIARERTLTRMGSSGEGVQYICTAIIYKGDCFDFFWCRRRCASHWIQATLLPLFLLGGSMSMNVGRSSEGMHFFLLVGREWWSHHDVERKPHKLSEGRCVMLTTIQNHSFSAWLARRLLSSTSGIARKQCDGPPPSLPSSPMTTTYCWCGVDSVVLLVVCCSCRIVKSPNLDYLQTRHVNTFTNTVAIIITIDI